MSLSLAEKSYDASSAMPNIIEQVQQILFEDVEFGQTLEKWCADRCSDFEGDEDAEHKLEWTSLHSEFCALFENKITGFLTAQEYSVQEFWEKLQKAADGEDANLQSEAFLVQALLAWVDYQQFVVTMRGLNATG